MMHKTIMLKCVRVLIVGIVVFVSGTAEAVPDTRPLRWNVVKVHPVYRPGTRKTFERFANQYRSFAEELERKGKSDLNIQTLRALSDYYRQQAESPWHGSGWIYFPKDDQTNAFVITNKDAVDQAGSVSLQFDGSPNEITDKHVIYVDQRYDIAIVEVPRRELPPECRGFELSETDVKEASEVWLAGFPTYGERTVFSLTAGHISTAELPGPEPGVKYIVHSAPANPGNNGGPLLVEVGVGKSLDGADQAPAYRVAGMNAWPVVGESMNNTAIPVKDLNKAISNAQHAQWVSRHEEELRSELKKSARQLANELGSSRPDELVLSALVSYTFVDQRPEIMTLDLLRFVELKMNSDELKDFLQSPVEHSRKTLLEVFRQTFATGDSNIGAVKFEGIIDDDKITATAQIRSNYTIAGKGQEITWIWERGQWRIANVSFDKDIQRGLKEIDSKFHNLGFSLADTESSSTQGSGASKEDPVASLAAKQDTQPTPAPVEHKERGTSFMIWAAEGKRGAIGDNFQSSLDQKQFSAFGVELAFPFSRYFALGLGLGYGPLGAAFETTMSDGRRVMINEDPSYLQLPLLFRFELPIETDHVTVRISGKAGLSGDLLVQKDGTMQALMDGTSSSLSGPSINWFDGHRSENMGVVYGGAVELGFGASPGLYFGAEVVSEQHLLAEWNSSAFPGSGNYRYEVFRAGLFVKYQSLH